MLVSAALSNTTLEVDAKALEPSIILSFADLNKVYVTNKDNFTDLNDENVTITDKTVSAAVKQLEDITYLRDQIGFENIPKGLVEAALARLEHPEATLKELGESLNPPVGKSGINHRLRKLSEMADKVRQEQGGLL